MRPRKRGRPTHRTSPSLLRRVLVEGFTLRQLAATRRGVALPTYRYRFRQALRRFVARPSPQALPRGPLVLLVDGLWFEFDGQPWVLYLTAVKACHDPQAVFLDPLLLLGKEGASRWRRVIAALPPAVQGRIRALIVDDLPGMRQIAEQRGWVLQLCHFHLLLKLRGPRRRGLRHALRGGIVRQELHQLIRRALDLPEGRRLQRTLERLRRLADAGCGTARIDRAVRECLLQLDGYRAYLRHPGLSLPRTTNAVESMGRILREMLRRSRAGSNPASLLLWATALLRVRPNVTCNGYLINRKP